jgi:hypothetical protein
MAKLSQNRQAIRAVKSKSLGLFIQSTNDRITVRLALEAMMEIFE